MEQCCRGRDVRRRPRLSSNAFPSSACSGHRDRDRAAARVCSSSSSRTTARRAASTVCVPISSPMQATNCGRRWLRWPASSRRCAVRRKTTRRRATNSCRSCRARPSRMARLIDDLLSLSRLEMKALSTRQRRWIVADHRQSVVRYTQPLATENGVSIENSIDEDASRSVGRQGRAFPGFRESCRERLQIWPVRRQGRSCDGTSGTAGRDRVSRYAISVPAFPTNTFRASPSASTASTSKAAGRRKGPASACRSSSISSRGTADG